MIGEIIAYYAGKAAGRRQRPRPRMNEVTDLDVAVGRFIVGLFIFVAILSLT